MSVLYVGSINLESDAQEDFVKTCSFRNSTSLNCHGASQEAARAFERVSQCSGNRGSQPCDLQQNAPGLFWALLGLFLIMCTRTPTLGLSPQAFIVALTPPHLHCGAYPSESFIVLSSSLQKLSHLSGSTPDVSFQCHTLVPFLCCPATNPSQLLVTQMPDHLPWLVFLNTNTAPAP